MMTVHEVSKLAGVSTRTLQYYDKIGLFHPTGYTDAGYRLYDDADLEHLQHILLFRELEFPLKDIDDVLNRKSKGFVWLDYFTEHKNIEKLTREVVVSLIREIKVFDKGNDGIDMDDEPEAPKNEKEVADRPAKNIPLAEKTVGTGQDKGIRQYADVPAERVSLKAKLEVMKAKVAGEDTEKPMPQKVKGKEETL